MNDFNPNDFKEELENTLKNKFKKDIKIKDIIKVGSGYHSDGFKISTLSGEEFF